MGNANDIYGECWCKIDKNVLSLAIGHRNPKKEREMEWIIDSGRSEHHYRFTCAVYLYLKSMFVLRDRLSVLTELANDRFNHIQQWPLVPSRLSAIQVKYFVSIIIHFYFIWCLRDCRRQSLCAYIWFRSVCFRTRIYTAWKWCVPCAVAS